MWIYVVRIALVQATRLPLTRLPGYPVTNKITRLPSYQGNNVTRLRFFLPMYETYLVVLQLHYTYK